MVMFLSKGGPLTDRLDQAGVGWQVPRERSQSLGRWAGKVDDARSQAQVYLRLARLLRSFRPDVVHMFLPGSIADGSIVARRVLPKAVRVAGLRGFTPQDRELPGWLPLQRVQLRARVSRGVRGADAVVVNAPHLVASEALVLGADPVRVRVIPNGVWVPEWVADAAGGGVAGGRVESGGGGGVRVVMVANFHAYKGHGVLVNALAVLLARGVLGGVRVRLCGVGGLMSELADRVQALGLSSVVEFVAAPADVAGELRLAQVGVHPSLTEGLSNAVLEELAAGLPVVVADVGGARLLVDDGVSGVVVPAGDVVALADGLERLLSDGRLRGRMGAAARVRAQSFSLPVRAGAHVDLYTELIAKRAARDQAHPRRAAGNPQ